MSGNAKFLKDMHISSQFAISKIFDHLKFFVVKIEWFVWFGAVLTRQFN